MRELGEGQPRQAQTHPRLVQLRPQLYELLAECFVGRALRQLRLEPAAHLALSSNLRLRLAEPLLERRR